MSHKLNRFGFLLCYKSTQYKLQNSPLKCCRQIFPASVNRIAIYFSLLKKRLKNNAW